MGRLTDDVHDEIIYDVIEELKKDLNNGDESSLFTLLTYVPPIHLISCLPKEEFDIWLKRIKSYES